MSTKALKQLIGALTPPPAAEPETLANYRQRPADTLTAGRPAPPPDTKYALTPPFTEQSRTEQSFVVAAGGTIHVPTHITFTDANGQEAPYYLNLPTIS